MKTNKDLSLSDLRLIRRVLLVWAEEVTDREPQEKGKPINNAHRLANQARLIACYKIVIPKKSK